MLRYAIERCQKKYASISDCFGNHHLDTVRQVMGVDAPRTVVAAGGRFILKADGEMALACPREEIYSQHDKKSDERSAAQKPMFAGFFDRQKSPSVRSVTR